MEFMKLNNLFKSMSGVSLVEMTVVLALIGVAGVGVMKLMDNANKAGKNLDNKDEIFQMNNQINDILKNPNNCEATLGGRTVGSDVPFLQQVINGVATPNARFTPTTVASPKVTVQSMTVLSVDTNGSSNGSQVNAVLRVAFLKGGTIIGGKVINKDITVNANFCEKNLIQGATKAALVLACSGANLRLLNGPNAWGPPGNQIQWGVCQDCSPAIVATNTIHSCQSQGSGGGVDINAVSQITCVNQGGTWNDSDSTCDVSASTAGISCTALGGTYTAPDCLFGGLTIQALIDLKTNPANFVNTAPPTCPAGGTYSLSVVGGKIQLNCLPPPPPVVVCGGLYCSGHVVSTSTKYSTNSICNQNDDRANCGPVPGTVTQSACQSGSAKVTRACSRDSECIACDTKYQTYATTTCL